MGCLFENGEINPQDSIQPAQQESMLQMRIRQTANVGRNEAGAVFRFKRFSVVNERSAMKVNTDGVLLGALATVGQNFRRALDVGTGTGTIALMVAQRLSQLRTEPAVSNPLPKELHTVPKVPDSPISQPVFPKNGSPISVDAVEIDKEGRKCKDINVNADPISVDAVEIDKDSAEEAAGNFSSSPWMDSLKVFNCPLADFESFVGASCLGREYDLIVSNPPFFDETLHSPDERKARTRHSDSLSWRDIVDFSVKWLAESDESRLSLILPSAQELAVSRYAAEKGFFLCRTVHIRSSVKKPVSRVIIEFSRRRMQPCDIRRENMTINVSGGYSQEYLDAMHDFLLFA